jgi:iron complex outermembrane receptor protein
MLLVGSLAPYFPNAAAAAESSDSPSESLNEIVVTAQKREERLQDVPIPVTALAASALVDEHSLRIQDYLTSIPGLNVSGGGLTPALSIRGLDAGGGNRTVGVVIDDIPIGSATNLGGGQIGNNSPDISPSELERVEVLRGPQGTLYGASSIGGLLKYVTVDPSPEKLSGQLQLGTDTIYNARDPGYNIDAAINVPVNPDLAVRVSGFRWQEPGYIDNIATNTRDVNQEDVSGGRISALWRPSEEFSLKVAALTQRSTLDGSDHVNLSLADLQQNNFIGTGPSSSTSQAYTAVMNAKIGSVDLTSLTGYSVFKVFQNEDFTPNYTFLSELLFNVPGVRFDFHGSSDRFSQELRLSMPLTSSVQWLFGGFYSRSTGGGNQTVFATGLDGTAAGSWLHDVFPDVFSEYAAFTDLTFHITDRFNIQVGGRESYSRESYSESSTGLLYPVIYHVPSDIQPEVSANENSFTYLITPQLAISPDVMVYARVASGYRPGGPNYSSEFTHVPPTFGPDKTQDYDLGFKGSFFAHRLSLDTSVYYINWKDIQISLVQASTASPYVGNGGTAKSEGVEETLEVRPIDGLALSGSFSANKPVLTAALPAATQVTGNDGDRLPYASHYSGHVAAEQSFPLTTGLKGFGSIAWSYVGERLGPFVASPSTRQVFPCYSTLNLGAGVQGDFWKVNLFANNVADKRGQVSGGFVLPSEVRIIQPRTLGISLSASF